MCHHEMVCRPPQHAHPHLHRSKNSQKLWHTERPFLVTSPLDGISFTVWILNHLHQRRGQYCCWCSFKNANHWSQTPSYLCNIFHQKWPGTIHKNSEGICKDTWCVSILDDIKHGVMDSKLDIKLGNGLLFTGSCLIIPKYLNLCKSL